MTQASHNCIADTCPMSTLPNHCIATLVPSNPNATCCFCIHHGPRTPWSRESPQSHASALIPAARAAAANCTRRQQATAPLLGQIQPQLLVKLMWLAQHATLARAWLTHRSQPPSAPPCPCCCWPRPLSHLAWHRPLLPTAPSADLPAGNPLYGCPHQLHQQQQPRRAAALPDPKAHMPCANCSSLTWDAGQPTPTQPHGVLSTPWGQPHQPMTPFTCCS
jgi:hypothetical protein